MNTMPHRRAFVPAAPARQGFVSVVYWVIDGKLHESVRAPLQARSWAGAKVENLAVRTRWLGRFPDDNILVLVRRADFPQMCSETDDRVSVDTREWLQSG